MSTSIKRICYVSYVCWLVEQGLTSHSTQFRSFRRLLQVRWPNQLCQSTEGRWLVIQIALERANKLMYTVSQKNFPLCICPYLHQILIDFENSFTGTLRAQFAIVFIEYPITP